MLLIQHDANDSGNKPNKYQTPFVQWNTEKGIYNES